MWVKLNVWATGLGMLLVSNKVVRVRVGKGWNTLLSWMQLEMLQVRTGVSACMWVKGITAAA